MEKDAPIGLFDSGLGGVGVLKTAIELLPHEHFIYYGDDGHAPYGTKTRQEIMRLSKQCVDFLLQKGVKAILIACNTATGVAVKTLREVYDFPIVSMEPAVKVGLTLLRGGKIVVMATPATLRQEKYLNLIARLGCADSVIPLPCDGLVELIEAGKWNHLETEGYLAHLVDGLSGQKVDCVVLGCTHYVFVREEIRRVFESLGKDVRIVDGSEGTVNHLRNLLNQKGLLRTEGSRTVQLYTSGDKGKILPLYCKALGETFPPENGGIIIG